MRLFRLLQIAVIAVCGVLVFSGCHSTTATTAHYRGDSVYGGDGKDSRKGKGKGGKKKGGKSGRYHDKELLARAKRLSDPLARALVTEAESWLGVPYRYGGQDKDGTDCSGMIMEVYRNVCGLKLPRSSRDQSDWCQPVATGAMQPGDLVFFASDGESVSHVGMYVGNGEMIHASSSRGVMLSPLSNDYWANRFYGVGRVASAETAWQGRATRSSRSSAPSKTLVADAKKSTSEPKTSDGNLPDTLLEDVINQKIDSIFVGSLESSATLHE